MASQLITYTGLRAGLLAWMARDGDTRLDSRFDDFLLNCERRMYYGFATADPGNPLRSDPLRIAEMEVVDPGFPIGSDGVPGDLAGVRLTEFDDVRVTEDFSVSDVVPATVPQPTAFLELISAQLNSPVGPLEIVAQRIIDGYTTIGTSTPQLIAVSGLNFRIFPPPGDVDTVTLRYYQKLDTPTAAAANDILINYPDVYLYGCLIEAAIFTQDEGAALRYLQLYNASVSGLNARTQRITASAVPVIRMRGARTP